MLWQCLQRHFIRLHIVSGGHASWLCYRHQSSSLKLPHQYATRNSWMPHASRLPQNPESFRLRSDFFSISTSGNPRASPSSSLQRSHDQGVSVTPAACGFFTNTTASSAREKARRCVSVVVVKARARVCQKLSQSIN